MAAKRWSAEEYDLLIAFYEREGPRPPAIALRGLQLRLARRVGQKEPELMEGDFRTPFRTTDALRAQLYRLRLIDEENPRASELAPRVMFQAWKRRAREREVGEAVTYIDVDAQRTDAARRDLASFLVELEQLLGEFVQRAPALMGSTNAENFQAAWGELQAVGNFERARAVFLLPDVNEEIVEVGLTGSQLHAKLEGFRNALKRLADGWTWSRLRPSLRWANVLLGSLAQAASFGMIDSIREVKEIGEVAAEESEEEAGR